MLHCCLMLWRVYSVQPNVCPLTIFIIIISELSFFVQQLGRELFKCNDNDVLIGLLCAPYID